MLRNLSSSFKNFAHHACASVFCALLVLGGVFFVSLPIASAQGGASTAGWQGAINQANQTAQVAGINQQGDLVTIIGRIINVVLGFLGIILLVLFLYAGFLWMTAAENAAKVEQAKKIMQNAVIGLAIIVAAWAITSFIIGLIADQLGNGGSTGPGSTIPGGGFSPSAGALGMTIESHYPQRNATNVARNTSIIIRFKRAIQISSIVQGYNDNGTPADLTDDTVTEGLNDASIRIYRTSQGVDARLTSAQVRVRFTADRKTFVFRPVEYLGSPSEDVQYTVQLPASGVMLENGTPLFGGVSSNGYEWTFETGTLIDITPPRVLGVFPRRGGTADRNAVIQIFFSEEVDPTAVSGLVSSRFSNIAVYAGGMAASNMVDGEYRLSSDLKSVEFIPSLSCGMNTCGEEMFCLPEGSPPIDVQARAATLDGAGPTAQFMADGYDGVVDVAANSMDGNGDGTAQGRGADDYAWSFGLTNNINLTPPTIEETAPPAQESSTGRENVDPFVPVTVRFDSILQSSTFNTDNAMIAPHESPEYSDTFWWTVGTVPLTDRNDPVLSETDVAAKTQGLIMHRQFATSTLYDPAIFSGVKNAYQNCFNPASSNACTGRPHCCLDNPSETECSFTP